MSTVRRACGFHSSVATNDVIVVPCHAAPLACHVCLCAPVPCHAWRLTCTTGVCVACDVACHVTLYVSRVSPCAAGALCACGVSRVSLCHVCLRVPVPCHVCLRAPVPCHVWRLTCCTGVSVARHAAYQGSSLIRAGPVLVSGI